MKKIKLGMFWESQIVPLVGKSDRADTRGQVTGKFEEHYKIEKTEGVAFVILAFDKDTDNFPNEAKLIEAKIIYTDRRIEDLPLQQ
jgi:hypothetical protein